MEGVYLSHAIFSGDVHSALRDINILLVIILKAKNLLFNRKPSADRLVTLAAQSGKAILACAKYADMRIP